MAFSPRLLLSNAARERCIARFKNLPALTLLTSETKPKIRAAVFVPICVDKGEVSLLYTLRSSNLKNHSGEVSFPGGKMDEKETVYETALREAKEEIGINSEDVDIWGKMSLVQMTFDSESMLVPIVGFVKNFDEHKLKINRDEVEDVFRISVKALCRTEMHGHVEIQNRTTPIYLYDKYKIWGITSLVTHWFLKCFLSENVYTYDFMRKRYTFDEVTSRYKLIS